MGKILTRVLATVLLLLSFVAPARAQDDPIRRITVAALVDTDLLENNKKVSTAKEIEHVVNLLSYIFRKEFGIEFKLVGIVPWRFPYTDSGNKVIEDASGPSKTEISEIDIAFTRKTMYKSKCGIAATSNDCVYIEAGGIGCNGGATMVIKLDDEAPFTAIHEMGHLFEARHVQDKKSVMNEKYTVTPDFDETNKKTIRRNKNRLFFKVPCR